MDGPYELWDVETGNVIGAFASADDALDVVAALLDAYGPGYADALDLSHRESGDARPVANGEELVAMARRRAQRRPAPAPMAPG